MSRACGVRAYDCACPCPWACRCAFVCACTCGCACAPSMFCRIPPHRFACQEHHFNDTAGYFSTPRVASWALENGWIYIYIYIYVYIYIYTIIYIYTYTYTHIIHSVFRTVGSLTAVIATIATARVLTLLTRQKGRLARENTLIKLGRSSRVPDPNN